MKKFLINAFLIMGILLIVGCKTQQETKQPTNLPEELVDKEWLFYDEVIGEHLSLSFRSDGSYSYHCQCGEPVGDSDVYECYTYDSDTQVIQFSNNYDDSTAEIEVISYNEYHLMVKIDGELKDFVLSEMDTSANFWWEQAESYFSGYNSRRLIVDIEGDTVIYGPNEYDPEGQYKDGPFEEYKLAEDASWYDLSITRMMTVEDGQEYEESYDVSFTECTIEEAKANTENGAGTVFVWFNENMEMEKIIFYGELSIYE